MAKLTLSDLTNLQNETTVVNTLKNNNDATEVALENTLSRDGTSPNQMTADLDMNSNQILNLPAAVDNTDPIRKAEFDATIDAVTGTGIALTTQGFVVSLINHGATTRNIVGLPASIDVSNGDGQSSNPIISVSATYPGNSNITTLGTIGTGIWQGTKVGLAYGGTNADLSATGGTSRVLKQVTTGAPVTVAQLAVADLSDTKTGTGNIVLATGPTILGGASGSVINGINSFSIRNVSGFDQFIASTGSNTANRTLNINVNDADRTITLGGNVTTTGSFSTSGAFGTTLTATGTTNVTLPTAGTLATLAGSETLSNKTLTAPILGAATATSINKVAITAPTTSATLTIPDGVTLTGPATSGTAMTLGNTETVTGVKTFGAVGNVGKLAVAGSGSGSTVIAAQSAASGTMSLPAATSTIVGTDISQTLTNKTISGSSNTISSVALSSLSTQAAYTFVGNNTGSTAVPTAVDIATLTSKASPAAGDFVMLSDQAASGAWKKATVSSVASAGSVSSIAGNTGAFTLANGIDNSTNQIQLTAARRTLPTRQIFTSGTSATYTTPSNCLWIEVELVGGGGGGGPSSTLSTAGTSGGATTFSTLTGNGGAAGGQGAIGGTGGTASGGDYNVTGATGSGVNGGIFPGGAGGGSFFSGGGGSTLSSNGANGINGSGGGGAGQVGVAGGSGGGAGGYTNKIITSPSATYTYTVGAAGSAGTGSGFNGGGGGAGIIIVTEHYGS